jgi:hypothetical protein
VPVWNLAAGVVEVPRGAAVRVSEVLRSRSAWSEGCGQPGARAITLVKVVSTASAHGHV